MQDFAGYDSQEIQQSIQTRRTRIFLLMEEVRRLRIEQRLKVGGIMLSMQSHAWPTHGRPTQTKPCLQMFAQGGDVSQAQELAQEKFNSALPFLPPLEEKTLFNYYRWVLLCPAGCRRS